MCVRHVFLLFLNIFHVTLQQYNNIIYYIRICFRLFPLIFMFRIKSHPIIAHRAQTIEYDGISIYIIYTVVFVSTYIIIIIVNTRHLRRLYLTRETISSNPTAFFKIHLRPESIRKPYYAKVHASYYHICRYNGTSRIIVHIYHGIYTWI